MKFSLKSDYFRHIATLLSGTAAAQLILFAATPFLARLYSPADFGVYAVFLAFTSILGVVASGRYEIAILLPRSDEEAGQLFRLCLIITSLFALFCFLLILLWGFFPFFENSEAYRIRFWLPGAIWLQGVWQALNSIGNRYKSYKNIAFSRLIGSIVTVVVTLLFAFWDFAAMGLIAGKLIGQSVETFCLYFYQKRVSAGDKSAAGFQNLFLKYQNMLRFSTIEGLLNTGFKQIPVFALSARFSLNAAGFYSMTQNILSKPVGLVSSAVGQVFFREAAELHHEGGAALSRFFVKNLRMLFLLILPPTLLIIFFGKPVFGWLLGSQWLEAGVYGAWLMPFIAVTFLKSPLSCIIDIKNQIRQNLIFEILFFCMSLAAFYLGSFFQSALLGVQIFSLGNSVIGIIQLFWFYKLTKTSGGFDK